MLRRLLIFGLLGPVLGFAVIRYGFLSDTVHGIDFNQLVLLPLAYYMGLVPALGAGLFDQALSDRGTKCRSLWTAAAGSLVGFLPILTMVLWTHFSSPWLLLWGLVGGPPSLICSLLSGKTKPLPRRSRAPSNPPGSAD